jgi:hypothetical protein
MHSTPYAYAFEETSNELYPYHAVMMLYQDEALLGGTLLLGQPIANVHSL